MNRKRASKKLKTLVTSCKPVNTINTVFEELRMQIPTFPYERRLSKIDTLHLSISYIHLLNSIIDSNLSLRDYLEATLNRLNETLYSNKQATKPIWATSGQ